MNEKQTADELYVLLRRNYRISRNIRLIWFFDNIFKDINKLPHVSKESDLLDKNGQEIQILSVRNKLSAEHDDHEPCGGELSLESQESQECLLHPDTNVYFLSKAYRLVFAIDLSPSVFRVDAGSYRSVAEAVLSRLADCLCSLMQSFKVPGSEISLHPNIYVTIFTQTRPTYKSKERYLQEVIVQGCLLTPQSVGVILRSVECKIYHGMKQYSEATGWRDAQHPVRHDHGLVSMLRTGLLALQLLPANTSSGIVIITDGIIAMPDMAVLESLLNQLRCTTTSCSFIHVPTSQTMFCDFSYCSNAELLQFIARATCGTWFDPSTDDNYKSEGMNIYQKYLLMWRFQMGNMKENEEREDKEKLDVRSWDPDTDLRYTPTQKNMFISPTLRKKQLERTLRVSIFAIISVRLREGYMINSISLNKNKSQIEAVLVFPWNHGMSVKYYASAGWPVVRNSTKIEVYIEGTYEFLSDVTVGIGQESGCRYRSIVVRRFKHFMKQITQTDHMLTHLLSFSSDPINYSNIQKHVPLFYLPPNSNQLVLSSETESSQAQLSYWKPVLSMDVNIWQRWLHTHHIEIILQHDMPLPKHLHLPSKNGRYHSIQTSFAMSQLSSLLREWSSFILLENQSYIKFVFRENEEKPSGFYIVRLSNKAPMVVIRLAFLIGTTGPYRNIVLQDLQSRVLSLTFPAILSLSSKQPSSSNLRSVRSRNPSAQQSQAKYISGSERQCAVLIHKPLDRVLIRYDQTPQDFMQPPSTGSRQSKCDAPARSAISLGGEIGATTLVQDLCRYMKHHRWVWSISNRSMTPISTAVAGEMASLMVKIRLSEGFNFASSSSGVITMAKEFPVTIGSEEQQEDTKYYCLAQFIIFPPTICTSRESFCVDGSGDEDDAAEGELFLSTEIWIEPQCGIVTAPESHVTPLVTSHASRHASGISDSGKLSRLSSVSSVTMLSETTNDSANHRFLGLQSSEIPQMIANEDRALLSVLATVEHLRLMCMPKPSDLKEFPQDVNPETQHGQYDKVPSDEFLYSTSDERKEETVCYESSTASSPTIEGITHVPCLFNLTELLDRSPRVKLLFMTFSHDPQLEEPATNDILFEYFHHSLNKLSDKEAILSDADYSSITSHMIERVGETKNEACTDKREKADIEKGKWRCYLKMLSKAKVLVILLPSAYHDLKGFAETIPEFTKLKFEPSSVESPKADEEGEANVVDVASIKTSLNGSEGPQSAQEKDRDETIVLSRDDYRLARRLSVQRVQAQEQSKNYLGKPDPGNNEELTNQVQLSLPVFVYECSTHSLVEQMVKDPMVKPSTWAFLDIEQDHRIKSLDSKYDGEMSRPKSAFFRSQSYTFHSVHSPGTPDGNHPFTETENVFSASFSQPRTLDQEVSDVCDNLVEAYHRCFVRGISHNLKLNIEKVASIDVQATDAICQESVQEIDITQFLLITCPQVASFKERHLRTQEISEERGRDDVFSIDGTSTLPGVGVEPMIRHRSSTSSTTDPSSQETFRGPRKNASQNSPTTVSEHFKRGNTERDAMSLNGNESLTEVDQYFKDLEEVKKKGKEETLADQLDSVVTAKSKSSEKSVTRSAFKKPRSRRPKSPPKDNATSEAVSDTDGDTNDSRSQQSIKKSKMDSSKGLDGSLPRSFKVSKPLKKYTVTSKAGLDGLPEFPLSALKESHSRHISGSDDQVKASFNQLIWQNFQSVRCYPDFFYYHAQDASSASEEIQPAEDQTAEPEFPGSDLPSFEPITESDADVRFEIGDVDVDPEIDDNSVMMYSRNEHDMIPTSSYGAKRRKYNTDINDLGDNGKDLDDMTMHQDSSTSSEDSYYEEEETEEYIDNFPLFLCMTCTVRDKKTGNHGTVHVDGLPTSLLSIVQHLEKPCTHIDLLQLHITLDLIWIMLPMETQVSKQTSPSYNDIKFSSGLLPDEDDSPHHESSFSRQRSHPIHEEQGPLDPLSMLPPSCLASVNNTKEQVEWLLQDEIICALRTCEMITPFTLEKVAKHVEDSTGSNCMKEVCNLQFVFGTEKSFRYFESEFEKSFKDFEGYRMKKEGNYYYFTMERTFLPIPHWPLVEFTGQDKSFTKQNNDPFLAEQTPTHSENFSQASNSSQSQHTTLCRTRTAPVLSKSLSSKPDALASQNVCDFNSCCSSQSLPNHGGVMSVDAIEFDVCSAEKAGKPKRSKSLQAAVVRKTSSAVDLTTDHAPGQEYKPWSPRSRSGYLEGRPGRSRSTKLAHTDTSDLNLDRSSYTPPDTGWKFQTRSRAPVKQSSFESNVTDRLCKQAPRRSSHSIIPLSLRNSPQPYSGPTSPHVSRQLSTHNSSVSSAKSAPLLNSVRRTSQATTPVAQITPGSVWHKVGTEPNSSTPMLQYQPGSAQTSGSGSASIAITPHYSNKDGPSSPVSMSDGEFRRYSTASLFESGYDGEESDMDGDDEYMSSLRDGGNDLPSFWLIASVQSDHVKIYFHRRSSAAVQIVVDAEHKRIFRAVINRVYATCKRVNQMLLLLELHDSRMCNALLVEETEEDIWKRDYNPIGQHSDDLVDENNRELLAATMTSAPGQFACDCVLEKVIPLHPRLRATSNVQGKSSVTATVRDLVRNLMVTNRKNMFVYLLPDKSVFYCRMEEECGSSKGDSRRSSMLIQASSSLVDNPGSLNDNMSSTPERRNSKESLPGVGLPEVKSGGSLTLRWYGVSLPNPQQREELEKMNQSIARKLDDAVLEKITVLLQRKSKLSPADVLFIQQSSGTCPIARSPANNQCRPVTPSTTLSYALPDGYGGCIPAIRYYLHQNLLQFMAVPRYTDPVQSAGHFTAYRMRAASGSDPGQKFSAAPSGSTCGDGSVFLFHQSIEPGKTGYGIACVVLEFTDSDGKQLIPVTMQHFTVSKQPDIEQLLKLTEVSSVGKEDSFEEAFHQNINTDDPAGSSSSKVFVRSHLWLKGSLTVGHLEDRLKPAVRHALFDCVTEFFVIQSPLCDSHPSLEQDDILTNMEPQKTKNVVTGKTDAMRSLFDSLNTPSSSTSIFSTIRQTRLDVSTREETTAKQSGNKRQSTPVKMERTKSASAQAEEGEAGNLKEIYCSLSQAWFDHLDKCDVPAVFKMTMELENARCLTNTLPDIQKIFGGLLPDCKVRSFFSPPGSKIMAPFDCEKDERESELPGRYPSHILIARNFLLWRKAIGSSANFVNQQTHSNTAKFPPYDASIKPEQSPRPQERLLVTPNATYIPRQQFVLTTTKKRSITIWGYNISNETTRNLQTKLRRCVDFHNARHRALHCLTTQKLGLLRHCTFENGFLSPSNGNQPNPFLKDVKDVNLVLNHSYLPSDRDVQPQLRSKTGKRVFFHEAYLSNKPLRPLQASAYGKKSDTATQYALQYLEMKQNLKKRNEEQQHLWRIYANWRDRPAANNSSIKKDALQILLQNSRLIHHVASPILFNATWRTLLLKLKQKQSVVDESTSSAKDPPPPQPNKKQKRLSGNIMNRKSGEFSGRIEDSRTRSRSNSTRKEHKIMKPHIVPTHESIDICKYDGDVLRRALMMHYIQYWQSMHFLVLKEEKSVRMDRSSRKPSMVDTDAVRYRKSKSPQSSKKSEENEDLSQSMFLYRVSSGGIVIVQISCVSMNFLVKLYILEASRLRLQSVNQQMAVSFLNECEHLKDYTHVHSFAYDFHLRYVQWYIQDRHTAIKPGFHLVSFLADFMEYYRASPLFVFNHLHSGEIEAPCTHVTPDELYEYIVGKQATHHGFKAIKLTDNEVERNEHAMVSARLVCGQFHSVACKKEEHEMYDVSYVVFHDPRDVRASTDASSHNKINLKYFVIFTNRRHLFPRFDLQDNINPMQLTGRHHTREMVMRRNLSTASNFPSKTAGEKTRSIHTSHVKSNSMVALSKEENVLNTTPAISTSEKSRSQSVLGADSVHKMDLHKINPQSKKTTNVGLVTSQPSDERPLGHQSQNTSENRSILMSLAMDKQRLASQGRRQSMPNFGATLRNKKVAIPGSSSSKQFLDPNRLQNPVSNDIQFVVDTNTISHLQSSSYMKCESQRLSEFLVSICKSAEIQCYRNRLWDKVYTEKAEKTSTLTLKEFEHLLQHCQKVPLCKLDPRGVDLCNTEVMGLQWVLGLQKHLMSRSPQLCRMFACPEGNKRYLGVLNAKLYNMMFLLTADTVKNEIGMFAVLRDRQEELEKDRPNLTNGAPSLIPVREHLNNMINFICYHTWMTLASS